MPLTEVAKLLAIFQNNFRNTKVSDDKFANITACNTIAQINFFILLSWDYRLICIFQKYQNL